MPSTSSRARVATFTRSTSIGPTTWVDFDFNFGRRAKAFVKLNRQVRLGEATTTLDISRDEFEFDRILDETKNDYTVGFQVSLDRASVYIDQTYRDYQTGGRTFLPEASPGENLEDSRGTLLLRAATPLRFHDAAVDGQDQRASERATDGQCGVRLE